ncbi:MAG: Mut7-C RNAse domain-containing protein [Dehalococcoidia bacterium]|nr:Mut7-C RNAse domain-containing protein [Dehalococcoidia bacterium]
MEIKFVADNNVGKLARWLRLIGYDTLFFEQKDDAQMIKIALGEDRVILTKDAQFTKRRLVANGTLKTIHIEQDDPRLQVQEVVRTLKLDHHFKPFSLCLECNRVLVARDKEEVKNLVPDRVFETQTQYTQCPACHRIYWPGTHWEAMGKELQDLQSEGDENHASI